jgi:hypothetical protein
MIRDPGIQGRSMIEAIRALAINGAEIYRYFETVNSVAVRWHTGPRAKPWCDVDLRVCGEAYRW